MAMNLLLALLLFANSPMPILQPASSQAGGQDPVAAVVLAGLCIGSAQQCLAEAIADGELSQEEIVGPYAIAATFEYNSSTLSTSAKSELLTLALIMNEPRLAGSRFLIKGHTDARGSATYNQELSERRAEVVANLLTQFGVERSRLRTIGVGESEPRSADPNAPENRRVELTLLLQ